MKQINDYRIFVI